MQNFPISAPPNFAGCIKFFIEEQSLVFSKMNQGFERRSDILSTCRCSTCYTLYNADTCAVLQTSATCDAVRRTTNFYKILGNRIN